MTLREANFEGQTPGTVIGIANSSAFGDDPFSAVSISGMSLTYGSTAMHGSGGAAFGVGAATQSASLRYGGFSASRLSVRVYVRLRNYPTNEFQILHTMGGTTAYSGFNITPTGTVKVVGVPTSSLRYTSTATMSLNTWYRFEFSTIVSATNGQIKFLGYLGDSATAISGMSYDSGTVFNTGTVLLDKVEVGKITASAATGAFDIDDYAVSDGTAILLGPFASAAPTVRTSVATGVGVVNATASTPGVVGDTLTFTISPSPLGTSQPARGIFLVPQQTTAVTYTVTVAESNGQTKSSTAVVPAATASTDTVPKVFKSGQWV